MFSNYSTIQVAVNKYCDSTDTIWYYSVKFLIGYFSVMYVIGYVLNVGYLR